MGWLTFALYESSVKNDRAVILRDIKNFRKKKSALKPLGFSEGELVSRPTLAGIELVIGLVAYGVSVGGLLEGTVRATEDGRTHQRSADVTWISSRRV
jgi:hypothetical protein